MGNRIFHFELRKIEEIAPWNQGSRPSLSWFGLSDGWYWIVLGGQELFRLRDGSDQDAIPYVDYQVVRLWEDVLDLLPEVLAPIPEDIAAHLRDPERFLAAVQALQSEPFSEDDALFEQVSAGLGFFFARKLDTGYLILAPRLWLWRDGDDMNLLFRSAASTTEALWEPVCGHVVLPVEEFLSEVQTFDRAFLGSMGERVDALLGANGRPGVFIDLQQLEREQRDRATWLQTALGRPRGVASDWESARQLLRTAVQHGLLPRRS